MISELTIKLIIILIPGAIATLIFGNLILHKAWNNFRFILYSILFGITSYFVLQLGINFVNLCNNCSISDLTVWNNLSDTSAIPYSEVGFASIIAIIVAFTASMIQNRKLIYNIAGILGVSRKYGEENLFSNFLSNKEVDYIYLRDIKNQLTYHGWVKSFSENELLSEILLSDVAIYNYSDSQYLYEINEVFLSLNKHEIIIETAKPLIHGKKETNTE